MSTEKHVIGAHDVIVHKLPLCTNQDEISLVSSAFSGNVATVTITSSETSDVVAGVIDFNVAMAALNKAIDENAVKAITEAIDGTEFCFALDPEIELMHSLIKCIQARGSEQQALLPMHKQSLKLDLLASFIIKSSLVPFAGHESTEFLRNIRFVAVKQGKLQVIPLYK